MLMFVRRRAIKVWILGACDAASQIVRSRFHLHPCVVHNTLNGLESDRAVLAALLLPVMEQRVVQWTQALGCIRRQKENLFDRLRTTVSKRLTNGVDILVNRSTIENQRQRVPVQSLHRLREYIVDELQQHCAIDSLHVCIGALFGSEDFGQENAVANAACDHVESLAVGRSLLSNDVRLLAWQHDGGIRGGAEAESSLIEEDDVLAASMPELAAKTGDLFTQGRIHYTGRSAHSSATHSPSLSLMSCIAYSLLLFS